MLPPSSFGSTQKDGVTAAGSPDTFRLAGRAGDGRQYISWIHEHDFVRSIDWIIEREHLAGPINLAAPEPLPNAEFMRALREAGGISLGLPATRLMLEVGAVFMAAPQSGSPMTYMADGKQYIVNAISGGSYSGEYIAFTLPAK